MPDFDLTVAGVRVAKWLDPGTGDLPSRLNPHYGRYMLRMVGTVGQEIQLLAVVNGVTSPADNELGGRTFVATCVESPSPTLVVLVPDLTSARQTFTPEYAGNYLLCMRRLKGGAVFAHVDVEYAR